MSEITMFTHLESQRPSLIFLLVTDERAEVLTFFAVDPVFLKGCSIVEVFPEIGETYGVRSQQPFVTRNDESIGINFVYVERQGSNGLGTIYNEQRTDVAGLVANGLKIKLGAIRPMDVTQGNEFRVRIDRIKN